MAAAAAAAAEASAKSLKQVMARYNHYVRSDTPVVLDATPKPYNLYIVYYINTLCNNKWYTWLYHQLKLVSHLSPHLYVVATVPPNKENVFRTWTLRYFPHAQVDCYTENEFEYQGIKKVWELSQLHRQRDDLLLYFHSKGITRNPTYASNARDNYNQVLREFDKVKEVFTIFPTVDKVGYCSSKCGGMWYNFWYARGSYLCSMDEPVKSPARHYYEYWLARRADGEREKISFYENLYTRPMTYAESQLDSCYSLYTDKHTVGNIGSYYHADDGRYYAF